MKSRIAIYGGNFNPPSLSHKAVIECLSTQFDHVIVIPCGPRPDKPSTNAVEPVYRAALADLAFQGLPKTEVDLFDLEQAVFTRNHVIEQRFASRGEIWHVVNADRVVGGARGESPIQREWEQGQKLWQESRFVIIPQKGVLLSPEDCPPNSVVISAEIDANSAEIRDHLYHRRDASAWLDQDVSAFIERHGLYRPHLPRRQSKQRFEELRLLLFYDERNEKAKLWAREFAPYVNAENPNCVLVIGGDGTMLHAIQTHWRKRVPFVGLNAGHLGFLLNPADEFLEGKLSQQEIILRQMPLLYTEMELPDGTIHPMLSFNDAWIERSTGQTAWVEVKVNGEVRFPKLVCDGVLVSTAAGSTAYARAMGASPLLADTQAWMIVGSNVMQPANWKSALLPMDADVEIRCLDSVKRPMNGYVYGVPLGNVRAMRARMSRIATVELGFSARQDLAEKIARIQFPQIP